MITTVLKRAGTSERGALSVFVVVLFVALMVMAGLVVDGGNAINARAKATDDAEQAARAAANQIDEDVLRNTGQVQINRQEARAAAYAHLTSSQLGYGLGNINVTFGAEDVTVVVTDTEPTDLLTLINITSFPVRGEATARPAVGIDQEIP